MSELSCAVKNGKAVFKNKAKQSARQRPLAEHGKAGRQRHPPYHALQAKKILTNFFASVMLFACLPYFFTRSLLCLVSRCSCLTAAANPTAAYCLGGRRAPEPAAVLAVRVFGRCPS